MIEHLDDDSSDNNANINDKMRIPNKDLNPAIAKIFDVNTMKGSLVIPIIISISINIKIFMIRSVITKNGWD